MTKITRSASGGDALFWEELAHLRGMISEIKLRDWLTETLIDRRKEYGRGQGTRGEMPQTRINR